MLLFPATWEVSSGELNNSPRCFCIWGGEGRGDFSSQSLLQVIFSLFDFLKNLFIILFMCVPFFSYMSILRVFWVHWLVSAWFSKQHRSVSKVLGFFKAHVICCKLYKEKPASQKPSQGKVWSWSTSSLSTAYQRIWLWHLGRGINIFGRACSFLDAETNLLCPFLSKNHTDTFSSPV